MSNTWRDWNDLLLFDAPPEDGPAMCVAQITTIDDGSPGVLMTTGDGWRHFDSIESAERAAEDMVR